MLFYSSDTSIFEWCLCSSDKEVNDKDVTNDDADTLPPCNSAFLDGEVGKARSLFGLIGPLITVSLFGLS